MCKSNISKSTTHELREERRRRNRISAQLCRQRRKKYHCDLASRLANLEATNEMLLKENMNLKSQLNQIDVFQSDAPAQLVDEIEDYFA